MKHEVTVGQLGEGPVNLNNKGAERLAQGHTADRWQIGP